MCNGREALCGVSMGIRMGPTDVACVCACACVYPYLMLKAMPKVASRLPKGGHVLIAWLGLGDVHI